MCGIAGGVFYSPDKTEVASVAIVKEMTDTLVHRGPDSSGLWSEGGVPVVLGHRRLAIIDLSPLGHQPMVSGSRRWVVVLNGEIYNYKDLYEELKNLGVGFKGEADTEVLLAAIEIWGLKDALERCVGMFAISVFDSVKKELHLARDRMGEKPLFYGFCGDDFLFSSELKAFKKHPDWRGDIDRLSLQEFLRYGYVPTPRSIFEGIKKLEAGTILSIPCDKNRHKLQGDHIKKTQYWSLHDIANKKAFLKTESELIEGLDEVLHDAVRGQMMADVPLGAFLSGGVDSSLIAAIMQAESHSAIETFTIGFNDTQYNEAEHAKAIAEHLGTRHTELYIDEEQVLGTVDSLASIYDEPFADPSQLPTYILCKMAKKHVTVCLSGDAGDELYQGYNRYLYAEKVWNLIRYLPAVIRGQLAKGLLNLNPKLFDKFVEGLSRVLPILVSVKTGDSMIKLQKIAALMDVGNFEALYTLLLSFNKHPEGVLVKGLREESMNELPLDGWDSVEEYMMYRDQAHYLQDDNMVKLDRASMAVSLEARVPLLDHRVVEYSWRVPTEFKLRDNKSKWLLREVLYRYVPKDLIERPKMGFSVPIAAWLRGPLREWAEELLDTDKITRQGYFEPDVVNGYWLEHQLGRFDRSMNLWPILIFQSWLENEFSMKG